MVLSKAFFRVLTLARSERWLVLIFTTAGVAIGCAQIVEPILFGRVIDALSKTGQSGSYVGFWIALGVTNAALSILLSITADRYAHRMRLRAMEAAFARTISLPYREHSLQGSGRVVRTIQSGADIVFHLILSFFRDNVIALVSVFLLIPLSFVLAPKLACVLFGLALIYGVANSLASVWRGTRQTLSRA